MCILGCNAVGDEQHYLIDCLHLGIKELILPLLSKINIIVNSFKEMSSKEKTVFILSRSNEEMLKVTGKLCYKVLNRFIEITR